MTAAARTAAPRSLLRRLLAGFLLVMLGIWLAALAHIVWQVKVDQRRQTAIVNRAWTRQIMLNMQSLPPDAAAMARIGRGIEGLRLDMFREAGFETHARTLVWLGRQLVYDSAPGAPPDGGWVRWVERDAARGITVERREKPNIDWVLTPSAANYLLSPLVYSLPFVLLPAWLIVRVGLRPLRAVAQALEARDAAGLAPLPASPYRELAPVVDAVNRLMRRLSERLAREHDFLADAAHELKTPLSVVQINAHLLETAAGAAQRIEAGAGLREGVARATHTVHQLLAFERARQTAVDAPLQDLDLAALLRERLAVAAPLALLRDVELELRADHAAILPLHRESMAALLDNIVGNAIKYSPDGTRVDVCLDTGAGAPCITVIDQGSGIAPALRARVFERFYRVPGQDQAGSGLGLAIADRAAARNGARIALDAGPGGCGLAVLIDFATTGRGVTPSWP
jgi:two-component system, OmpR family, sensor kinase